MKLSSYPHLVKEWHPTKNGELTPDDFTHGTHKKVWWLCSKGHTYKQISVTKRYAHLCIEHKSNLINRVMGSI